MNKISPLVQQLRLVDVRALFNCYLTFFKPLPGQFTSTTHLQVFDGLFGHQLFLLVPLHAAHHAGPDDADHGLLREVGLFHLLFGEGNNLNQ